MRATIDGRPVELDVLSYWSMNPSSARSSVEWHRIELELSRSELEALLGAEYEDLRRELADDFVRLPPEDTDERALVAHATLRELVEQSSGNLRGLVRAFLWGDLLERLFGANAGADLHYWLGELLEVTVAEDRVVFVGEASSRLVRTESASPGQESRG